MKVCWGWCHCSLSENPGRTCSQESPLSAQPWLGTPSVTSSFISSQLLSAIYRPPVTVSHHLVHFCPFSQVCKQTLSSVFEKKNRKLHFTDKCLFNQLEWFIPLPFHRHLLLRISELWCPLKVVQISWWRPSIHYWLISYMFAMHLEHIKPNSPLPFSHKCPNLFPFSSSSFFL